MEYVETTHLRVLSGLFKELFEVFIRFLLVISRLAPLRDGFAVEDEDVEERVQEEDNVRFDGDAVEEHRLGRSLVKRIRH